MTPPHGKLHIPVSVSYFSKREHWFNFSRVVNWMKTGNIYLLISMRKRFLCSLCVRFVFDRIYCRIKKRSHSLFPRRSVFTHSLSSYEITDNDILNSLSERYDKRGASSKTQDRICLEFFPWFWSSFSTSLSISSQLASRNGAFTTSPECWPTVKIVLLC